MLSGSGKAGIGRPLMDTVWWVKQGLLQDYFSRFFLLPGHFPVIRIAGVHTPQ